MLRVKRRDFATGLLLAAAGRSAAAQQSARPYTLAFVHSAIAADQLNEQTGPHWVRRFFRALRKLGLEEGRSLIVERFSAEGRPERIAPLAQAVVARKPDVILSNHLPLVMALKAATATIPIVAIVGDPLRSGLVTNVARPGGNLTGVSIDASVEVFGKSLQIIKQAVPAVSKVAFVGSLGPFNSIIEQTLREAGAQLGIDIVVARPVDVDEAELRRVFADLTRQKVDAAILSPDGSFLAYPVLLVELASQHRLPVMYPYRDYVDHGGFMTYAPDLGELAERLADDVDQVLKGVNAGDIPFYLPTKLALVINHKSAKAIGITLPPLLLANADEVLD